MKMNFDKSDQEDDQLLIDLLKKTILEEPSEQFVDNTIKAFLLRGNPTSFRIVKMPLILMVGICVLLFIPFLLVEWLKTPVSNPLPGIYEFVQGITFEFSNWYLVLPCVLLFTLIILVQIEIRAVNFQKFTK